MKTATHAIAIAALGITAILGTSPSPQASEAHHTVVSADAVKWGPAPPSLPPGAQAAVLLGSPAKEGPFVLRLKFPAGFIVPPHRHSKDEFVTVLSGDSRSHPARRWIARRSSRCRRGVSFTCRPGCHTMPSPRELVVQINGTGPFDVVYVDPKDDPRKK